MHQVILKKTPAPTYLICHQAPGFSWSNKNIFSPDLVVGAVLDIWKVTQVIGKFETRKELLGKKSVGVAKCKARVDMSSEQK